MSRPKICAVVGTEREYNVHWYTSKVHWVKTIREGGCDVGRNEKRKVEIPK